MKTEMLPGITQIFLFTSYTMKEREKIKRERQKERKEKETEIRSEVHVPQFSSQNYYTPLSRASPLSHRTRIYTQTGKYATRVSGIQWHETALCYSTFTLVRKESEREESDKEKNDRKKAL